MSKKKRAQHVQQTERIPETRKKIEITARNRKQHEYLRTIERCDVTIAEGRAGTGKTYLAALTAMKYMSEGQIEKIVICRPAVEAGGERLGHLPGGINEKMDPYIQPIFDAFRSYWNRFTIKDMMADGRIEIVPLAFMRGRTFRDTFILGDEIQNATESNLLMLLTRLGENRKMVLTGDPTQSDINGYTCFNVARRYLGGLSEVGFIRFDEKDVVRHETVKKILMVWPKQTIRVETPAFEGPTPGFLDTNAGDKYQA